MRSTKLLGLLVSVGCLAAALPTGDYSPIKREELYPAPDLGRIKVNDKREELYPAPDLGRIKVTDKAKREELYPAPDLGRITVNDG
ncbi:MAG: hypothetical protein LQ351_008143 [Letrouitia transgressa]|nr:MAG: hypothetical protein LQ351_008143 [Letrouitia transgressa]